MPALQAFEAAARLGSFTLAARERHLTHSAISRAVQSVEHWCGEALFTRRGPKVRLSPAGERLRERLAQPLQALHDALGPAGRHNATHAAPARSPLEVFTLPSLAATWLVPRLGSLVAEQPQLQLTLHTGYSLHSLPPLLPAVALRVGRFERQGLRVWPLWRDRLMAVATPAWAHRHGTQPTDWPPAQRLRHLDQAWPAQLAGQRLPAADGLGCNDALLLVQAALNGLGVAWIRRALVAPWLTSGELLALAEEPEAASERSTWLVCREELSETPAVRAFANWTLKQLEEPA